MQQGSTGACEQALHLGDKMDSHAQVALPLIAPPHKKRQLCRLFADENLDGPEDFKMFSILIEDAKAGLAYQNV